MVVRAGGTAGAAVSGLSENNGTVAAADQTHFTAEISCRYLSGFRVGEVKGYNLVYWLGHYLVDFCLQVRREDWLIYSITWNNGRWLESFIHLLVVVNNAHYDYHSESRILRGFGRGPWYLLGSYLLVF